MFLADHFPGGALGSCHTFLSLLGSLARCKHLLIPFLSAVVITAASALDAFAGFHTAPSYPVGAGPVSVAVGDFNNDGILDLVTANSGDSTVSVLLGKGDGTFQAAVSYAAGAAPNCVAVGDFNRDGQLDLAVADAGDQQGNGAAVSILLGNGEGTFQAAQSYAAGFSPRFLVVGDFNGDGTADLAVVNHYPGSDPSPSLIMILLGDGQSGFQAGASYNPDSGVWSAAVGDFNGDGILDLALGIFGLNAQGGNSVRLLLGTGDGTFQIGEKFAVGSDPGSLAVGDFNGDGLLDLAVANSAYFGGFDGPSDLSILLGKGDGTFQQARHYALVSGANAVAVGDFNNDGRIDLAVTGITGVTSLLGNGDGTFQTAQAMAHPASSVAVGDFNGDGNLDFAVVIDSGNVVILFLGRGDGTFRDAPTYAVPFGSLAVADFNRDGSPDLATGGGRLLLGNGDGSFQPPQEYGATGAVAVGDFNGDSVPDLAVCQGGNPGSVQVLLGNGDGTFRDAGSFPAGDNPTSIAVADFNGDGKDDIVTTNFDYWIAGKFTRGGITESDVRVYLSNGDGTFQDAKTFPAGKGCNCVAVGDFNNDGIPDLVVGDGGSIYFTDNRVNVLLGKGDGTFHASYGAFLGYRPRTVAVGDFNGDGAPDIAVAGDSGKAVSVMLGNGDGRFQPIHDYATSPGPTSVAVDDFNRDGNVDLAVASWSGLVTILLGNGDGTFQAAQYYAAAGGILVVGDFNGDGYPDLAIAGSGNPGTVMILLNDGKWTP